mmetsp:Transcript_34688/g.56143  ORF Transcript_34688/g.56143 Transcript_34688/m.56143 type:complete len:383 (-) Transcript_34688:672-1820(-)
MLRRKETPFRPKSVSHKVKTLLQGPMTRRQRTDISQPSHPRPATPHWTLPPPRKSSSPPTSITLPCRTPPHLWTRTRTTPLGLLLGKDSLLILLDLESQGVGMGEAGDHQKGREGRWKIQTGGQGQAASGNASRKRMKMPFNPSIPRHPWSPSPRQRPHTILPSPPSPLPLLPQRHNLTYYPHQLPKSLAMKPLPWHLQGWGRADWESSVLFSLLATLHIRIHRVLLQQLPYRTPSSSLQPTAPPQLPLPSPTPPLPMSILLHHHHPPPPYLLTLPQHIPLRLLPLPPPHPLHHTILPLHLPPPPPSLPLHLSFPRVKGMPGPLPLRRHLRPKLRRTAPPSQRGHDTALLVNMSWYHAKSPQVCALWCASRGIKTTLSTRKS